ncbi:pteridine reductase [Acidiferrobacter sp.]|uniref:pteridine reductase n=1 Tax=Acidiferrobacter sp. TaxID=1872107 RepID=UPI002618DA19|nr:pteridine reductase [Acidiferrobacter sp.]
MQVSHEPVALVTGGGRRLGAAIARQLHARGLSVVVHYRSSADEARLLKAELESIRPGTVAVVSADILAADAPDRLIDTALTHFGRLDVLVNNASTFYETPLDTASVAQWDDLIGTNLRAPFFLCQRAAPHLAARAGAIVNMIDIHAHRPLKDFPIYSVAKAGLAMLTQSLARELAPRVRVNGVAPGAILWPESGAEEAYRARVLADIPLHRTGSPEDIARAVTFFLLDAPYITGQILAVDGGRSTML